MYSAKINSVCTLCVCVGGGVNYDNEDRESRGTDSLNKVKLKTLQTLISVLIKMLKIGDIIMCVRCYLTTYIVFTVSLEIIFRMFSSMQSRYNVLLLRNM